MKIKSVLKESFHLLHREPKIFVPKIITTTLYTFFMIYLARVYSEMIKVFGGVPESEISSIDPAIPASFLGDLLPLIAVLLLLLLVDLISYAMYPSLIRDHYSKKPLSILNSLKDALSAWRIILVLFFLILFFFFAGSIFISLFQILSLIAGASLIYASLSSTVIILPAMLVLMIALFFIVPVAVIDQKGLIETFYEGFRLSFRHKKDLFTLNLFFMALTYTTFLLLTFSEINYTGIVAASSIIFFILVRLFQAVIYTYISVVNPYFYMKIR